MIKTLKYLDKKDWLFVFLSLVFVFGTVYFELEIPGYMAKITTLVQTEGSVMNDVWSAGGMMLLSALGSLICAIIVAFFASNVAASMAHTLRDKVFDKTMSFSMEEMNRFSTSSLITRSTNDITQIQVFIAMGLQAIVKSPIMTFWAINKILDKNWQWTAATGGAVLIILVIVTIVITYAVPRFKKVQVLTDDLNHVTRENLTGLRVIRAYNAEDYQEDKFEKVSSKHANTHLYIGRIMSLIQPTITFVMSSITLAIYTIGAFLINAATGGAKFELFSEMVTFSSYAVQIIMSFMLLIMIFILFPRASVSAARINEVLDTEPVVIDGNINDTNTELNGVVEFRNVSFQYPDASAAILKNINFIANKGETVAFIGSTGSGKSTLINLIPRFHDVTEGEILVDGINVKDYTQEALRNKLGYASQRAILFSGTIRSNINFGENGKPKANDQQMDLAMETAQGKEFVDSNPEKYDASVSQGGMNFSGGQKQRISIARAINRDAEILLFDDSFSALDYKTNKKVREALKKNVSGTTNLIVAQRIGTIKDADKIIVLDKGQIVGMGTHKELMQDCRIYQEIALSQLSEEELKHA